MFDTIRNLFDETYVRVAAIGLLALTVMFVAFAGRSCGRDKFADPARERLQAKCATELGGPACEDLIARYHEVCARHAYHTPKYAQPSFSEADYDACVMKGPEAYYEDRRRARREAEQ